MDKQELAQKIKNLEGLTNEEKAALLQLLNHNKKYGLIWEEKTEDVEERLRDYLPVLYEVKDRFIPSDAPEAPNHIIIEGDNLEALTTLSYTHEGKIDVIYIDPPYNTGNKDFVYNDHYVDSEDSYRHSKWLSFMNKRLKIAKRLLSDRGVIFISIDDNEQAQLKLLCDEIFGIYNFAGDIAWQRSYSPRNDSKGISNEKEHLVVYSRSTPWTPNPLPRTSDMDSKYKNPDNDYTSWTSSDAFAPSASTHQGMVYAIQHPFTGKLIYPYKGACWPLQQETMLQEMKKWGDYHFQLLNDDEERANVCGISKEEIRKGVPAIILSEPIEIAKRKAEEILEKGPWPKFYFTNKGKGGIRRKTYLSKVSGKIVTNLWPYLEVGHTDEAKKELASIFNGAKPFDTPKPSRYIKRIVQIASNQDSIVLDFFAGSGTTLHATMQLNSEDGGHRQCILVTNNENNICEEVTYERNKRVINGYTTPKGVKVEGLHNNTLRYFKTASVSRDNTSINRRNLMEACVDLLRFKEGIYYEPSSFGEKKIKKTVLRYFKEKERQMLVVLDERVIPFIVPVIKSLADKEHPMKIYVYSDGQYAYDDDFADVLDKVELIAMPDSIMQSLRRVLPARDVSEANTPLLDETEISEALADTYNYQEKEGGEK